MDIVNISESRFGNIYNMHIEEASLRRSVFARSNTRGSSDALARHNLVVTDNLYAPTASTKQKEYESYLKEYNDGLTKGNGIGGITKNNSLEEMYSYAMEQFEKITNSNDTDEIKDMRRTALEVILKQGVDRFTFFSTWTNYRLALPEVMEKNSKVMAEARDFQYNQFKAVTDSVRKLTLNFLDYVKNTNNFSFDVMIAHINKSASNTRDVNNLSLNEVNSFFDYVKNSDHRYTQSKDDIDFLQGYFTTVSDKSVNDTINKWGNTVFNPLIHQQYATRTLFEI